MSASFFFSLYPRKRAHGVKKLESAWALGTPLSNRSPVDSDFAVADITEIWKYTLNVWLHHHFHVVCLTIGSCPLPKWVLQTVWSSASSFILQYLLTCTSSYSSLFYSVILSVLDPRKCEYLKDYSLDFEHAYMTTYLASWKAFRY